MKLRPHLIPILILTFVLVTFAIQTGASEVEPAIAPNYPFASWATLKGDGTAEIGGQALSPWKQFQLTGRDDHNVARGFMEFIGMLNSGLSYFRDLHVVPRANGCGTTLHNLYSTPRTGTIRHKMGRLLPHLIPVLILTFVLVTFAIQQLIVLPRLRKELYDLNARRMQRVQAALAAQTSASWAEPAIAPNYPFAAWVTLKDDGTVMIGGKALSPWKQFQVTVRDDHNVPRAVVIAPGNGELLITSLGQVFRARFENDSWTVHPANT